MRMDEAARVKALHELAVLDTPREERYDRIVRLAQDVFEVKAAAVNLIDADRQWTKAEVGLGEAGHCAREESFCTYTISRPEAMVVADARADERFRTNPFVVGDPRIRFYAGHPLRAPGGERVGTLCLIDPAPRDLDARRRRILAEMAGWVERELAAQHEIDDAVHVQRMLMPRTTPALPGYELAAHYAPARDLGGDFYDWYLLGEQLQLHVADVMGKGIPAALVAASVRSVLHGASKYNDQARTIDRVGDATQRMLEDTAAFVTAFSARLTPSTGALTYVDAGHGLAVIYDHQGHHRRLDPSGPPLGVLPGTTWTAHTTTLAPGETLLVVSDGFLDYFPDMDTALARAAEANTTSATAAHLVERLTRFATARGLDDDTTALALRRTLA
ncbi:PP2C family protein-serine/threonine phosphatase [Kocuria sp. CPCC 205263]|uniref:PP2C family protein-serine/threonine phosphatase n=1 Tax=Kocuria sp. CPCC 205263 TaxID=3073555 RepID=UPI0034D6A426